MLESQRSQPSSAPPARAKVGRTARTWTTRERWRSLVQHELWIDRQATSAGGELLRSTGRTIVLAVRGFAADQCMLRARALTYITVLSLVPLLAFSFSVIKGFGLHARLIETTIDPFLNRTFGPLLVEGQVPIAGESSHGMRIAIAQVLDLVNQTDVSRLGAIGLVFLIYTVVNLLGTIERSFNVIWRVPRARSLVRKITDYLAMVLIAPLFLFTATALTTAAQASALDTFLGKQLGLSTVVELVLASAPVLALWGGFTFIYLALPNARTRWSSALLAGLVAALLWQITLVLHVRFQIGLARYNAIYYSFAAIPIFLVWVQISWVTVLFGAELCVAHQGGLRRAQALDRRTPDQSVKEHVALAAATRIGASFLAGEEPWTAERLARDLHVPLATLDPALSALVEHRILSLAQGPHGAKVYLPAQDLDQTRVVDVLDATRHTPAAEHAASDIAADPEVERALAGLSEAARESRHNDTLKNIAQASIAARGRETLERTRPSRAI